MPPNLGKPIQELTNEELVERINYNSWDMVHIPLAELTRRQLAEVSKSINELKKAINRFSSSSEKYSRKIIGLTWALVVLTVILAIPLAIDLFTWLV